MKRIDFSKEADVIQGSQIKLYRNYADLPFLSKMDDSSKEEAKKRVIDVLNEVPEVYRLYNCSEFPETASGQARGRLLFPGADGSNRPGSTSLLREDNHARVNVNQEDHVEIQTIEPFLDLETAKESGDSLEALFAAQNPFAFDPQFGYLTSKPMNAGTGMRVTVAAHLPALAARNKVGQLVIDLAKHSLLIRRMKTEEGGMIDHLYQISNRAAIGKSEDDIIRSVMNAAFHVVALERAERDQAAETDDLQLEDRLMRSVGVLERARLLSLREFLEHASNLRYAICMDCLSMPLGKMDELCVFAHPTSLSIQADKILNEREENELRAETVRKIFG